MAYKKDDKKDKKGVDYTLTKETREALKEKDKLKEVPIYFEGLESLTEQDKKDIVKEIFDEFEEIKNERSAIAYDEKMDALDRQAEGKLQEDVRRQFNLTMGVTKNHENQIVNDIMEAYLDSDPIHSVSPRPGFEKAGGQEVCDKQSNFLDDRLDYLPFRSEETKVVRSAVRKGLGWLKIFHHVEVVDRKREEEYEGENIPIFRPGPNRPEPVIDPKTGKQATRNPGLEEFLKNWEDAEEDYPGLVEELKNGKKISIVAEYKDTVYNDPKFKYVDNKNFYCRLATEGYEGLKVTRLTVERMQMDWWALKRQEASGTPQFENVDELIYENTKEKDEKNGVRNRKKHKNYKNKNYNILECVYWWPVRNEKGKKGKEVKVVCWIEEEKRLFLGGILYPFYSIDCYYIPHYIRYVNTGILQPGIGEDLTDSELAEAVMLNSALEGAYIANLVTPITEEGSDVDIQFIEKRWVHGLPLNAKGGEIDFLQKYMKPPDTQGMLALLQYMLKRDESKTGASELLSGRTDPVDPNAPGNKTGMLLNRANKHMKAYIRAISPSFNEIGEILLQMYHQISREGRKYRMRDSRRANDMPFAEISRNEMGARTIIEVQAYAFDFDKQRAKDDDMLLYKVVRAELIIASNPQSVYILLKNLIKSWSPKWRNLVDQLMPPLEQLKQEQLRMTLQALALYISQVQKDSQITGQPPKFSLDELMPMVQEAQRRLVNPPTEEEMKAQKNANA